MRRKTLMTVPLLGLAMSLLAACSGAVGQSAENELTFVSYGQGAYQDGQENAWIKPFEQQNDSKITIAGPSDNAKLRTMVDSGNVSWDVVDTDAYFPREHCGTLLEKIDVGKLASGFPKGTLSDCGVPDAFFGLVFMYNTKTYGKNPPTRLADFFDAKKYPGKRSVSASDPTNGRIEAALLGDGVAPDQLYPLDTKRALRVYDRVKSRISFAQTYGQQQQTMVDDQADLALLPSARAYSVLKAGGTFWKPVWDKVPVSWDTLVIPKGSSHKVLAQKFVQFASRPERQAKFAELSAAGPANTTARPTRDDLQKQVDALGKEHEDQWVMLNADWWTKNHETVSKAWTSWMLG